MLEELKKLANYSKSRYYSFPVSTILECQDGKLFRGVNVETSSPAAGICAERNALFQALAMGYTKKDFQRIYIYNESENLISPCFICRQALNDDCNPELEIISYNCSGEKKTLILKDLCQDAFGEDHLK